MSYDFLGLANLWLLIPSFQHKMNGQETGKKTWNLYPHISIQLWVRTTTSKHKIPNQISTIKLSTPQNHPILACWEIDHQHGNALQSVSVDPNVPPGGLRSLLGLVVTPTCWSCVFLILGLFSHKHPPEGLEFLSLDPPTKNSCANATVELGGGGSINTWIMMMDQLLFYLPASNKLKNLGRWFIQPNPPRMVGKLSKITGDDVYHLNSSSSL